MPSHQYFVVSNKNSRFGCRDEWFITTSVLMISTPTGNWEKYISIYQQLPSDRAMLIDRCLIIHWYVCGTGQKWHPIITVTSYERWHIEAETRWPPYCRRHFQTHFLEWKYGFRVKFHWISFLMFKLTKKTSIASDNGLVPNKRQAIIWNNGGLVYWRIYASLGFSK